MSKKKLVTKSSIYIYLTCMTYMIIEKNYGGRCVDDNLLHCVDTETGRSRPLRKEQASPAR